MGLLDNKVAVVTGAAKANGIGFAACKALAMAGAAVVITDIDAQRTNLEQRRADIEALGGRALAATLDLGDAAQADACIALAEEAFGGVDIVFNNAGHPGGMGLFHELADEVWQTTWEVNVLGALRVVRAALPALRRRGGGSIINNASLAGLGVVAGMSAYTTSKFAVVGLTKAMAAELGKHNIRVNAICPGMVWTDMGRLEAEALSMAGEAEAAAKARLAEAVPLGQRWAQPAEVGDAVLYLASAMSSYVTGIALPVAGGLAPGL
ncbi:MAG: SDR family oxidoreductase [Betaproteobacteria bacterium]|nr:SDR family oxidoreductase [Betaproteobacteria bacterium]